MLNIFKLGKYVVAWSLPLAQTSNTKTHLHKRSRQTIQVHLKKQPANVLMFKIYHCFMWDFKPLWWEENFGFRKVCTVHTDCVCVWNHIHYMLKNYLRLHMQSVQWWPFLQTVFLHIEVIMNDKGVTQEHWEEFSCS